MLTENEIKRAVELAGWVILLRDEAVSYVPNARAEQFTLAEPPQWALDALAAALVRVVDETGLIVVVTLDGTYIWKPMDTIPETLINIEGEDRTENTILAVLQLAEKYPELFT